MAHCGSHLLKQVKDLKVCLSSHKPALQLNLLNTQSILSFCLKFIFVLHRIPAISSNSELTAILTVVLVIITGWGMPTVNITLHVFKMLRKCTVLLSC